MRISFKFTAAFLAVFSLVLGSNSLLRIQRESSVFEADMKRDHDTMGRDLAAAVARIWETSGRGAALSLVDEANESKGRVSIRWIDPDADPASRFRPTAPAVARRALQTDREVTSEILNDGGQDLLCTYVPVLADGQAAGLLEFSESLEEREQYVQKTIRRVLFSTLTVFVLAGAVSVLLGAWIVGRPVKSLISRANAIAKGDLERRLHFTQKDELSQLADALNTMCDQLVAARDRLAEQTAAHIASLEQLRHADRLAMVGQLASGVAHELGTPLNVVIVRSKMIRTSPAVDAEAQNNARIVIEQAERMAKIIRQLLDFARPKELQRRRVDLREILARVLEFLASAAQEKRVALKLDPRDAPLWAEVDPAQLQQVVSNLIVNAIQATAPGREVQVGCCLESVSASTKSRRAPGTYICIYVSDQGHGIGAEDVARVFEPFFTTKCAGEGTGLGLSVSLGIIREHQGWIEVDSEVGKGSRFSVYLPEGGANEEPGPGDRR